jgi:FtsP/CotA-like multicopper oxidase with cupredoxin domain
MTGQPSQEPNVTVDDAGEATMVARSTSTRRHFLRAAGLGAASVAAGGGLVAAARGGGAASRVGLAAARSSSAAAATRALSLAATDGHIILPNRPDDAPLYIFGFVPVPNGASVSALIANYKGKAQHPAPVLDFGQEDDVKLTLTNLGLVARPDLTDAHTVHWHGFRTPASVMDGVPEVSIAVPLQRQFTYFYRPHHPGTYMYHCHMEDVEHVQMGMTGIVFVRPTQGAKVAYNDGDGSTAFNREFAILLNEIWTKPHDNGENIQESIWTDYKPDYWTMNGRVYPQTILPNDDPSLPSQPISSLIQCNGGDKVLLRLANLGYQQHAMQLPGIPLRVVGEDATLLRAGAADLSYRTNTLYLGPGEARDVLFTAPAFSSLRATASDAAGTYNSYWFRNRNSFKLTNGGAHGLGGMVTQVRVYSNTLPGQTRPNQTYA